MLGRSDYSRTRCSDESYPGRMTRKGNNILGTDAMRGVRRAAFIESAAMPVEQSGSRCTSNQTTAQNQVP